MSTAYRTLRRRAALLVAIALVAAIYGFARLPVMPASERAELASRFHFTRLAAPEIPGSEYKYVRQVHPSLKRISAWISSVGAGVALADLDGDGLSNDLCQVEPRTDQVIVAPVPGTGDRYKPFTLVPNPIRYDPSTMAPMGCLGADLNEDGLMDILVYYWGRTPVAFLRKTGKPGVASPVQASDYLPVDIVPTGERWFTNALTLADLDGDGHIDIMVGNYFQDGGQILDAKAGGVEAMHNTKSKSYNGGHKHLLLWSGGTGGASPTVKFQEASRVFSDEVSRGWALGAGAADLDGDMLPELSGPAAAQPVHAGPPAIRRAGGYARLYDARLLCSESGLVQGHGHRFRRRQRRRPARHLRQQYRRPLRSHRKSLPLAQHGTGGAHAGRLCSLCAGE